MSFSAIGFMIKFLTGDETEDERRRYPANIYLFKANNRNTRKRSEICSKLSIKIPVRRK